jgi:biotin synthase
VGKLEITLSLGEQQRKLSCLYEAGAHRYLLRIETSDPVHYKSLHLPIIPTLSACNA